MPFRRGNLRGPRGFLLQALLLCGSILGAGGKEAWTEIHSPHFMVYCEDGETEGRKALEGFEAIRGVFNHLFPGLQVDPPKPMLVIVTHDESSMKRFLPAGFEGKDPVRQAGFFIQGADRNYALLRLDVGHQVDQAYFVLFHEYVHSVIHLNFPSLPTWLDEGLADFYGATEIHGNRVYLGRVPVSHLLTLRQHGLLPMASLLTATQDSPYYQEGTKAGPFYAQSWALTHYLLMDETAKQAGLLRAYLKALERPGSPLAHAQEGLGDLPALEKALNVYIHKFAFHYVELPLELEPASKRDPARSLDEAEALVVRAEFLMATRQEPASRPLLARALALAPQRPDVLTALGLGALLRGDKPEAWKDLQAALRGGSLDFRVPYHLAVLAQDGAGDGPMASSPILAWLEAAQSLWPDFPGTWMARCRQYTIEPRDAKQAIEAGSRAVKLEPRNLANWANLGSACMSLGIESQAKAVGEHLERLASNPAERRLAGAYAERLAAFEQVLQHRQEAMTAGGAGEVQSLARPSAPPSPMRFSLPSNMAPLGQEVLGLVSAGEFDRAIQKVEAARQKVRSTYEQKSLASLIDLLKARKAAQGHLAQPAGSGSSQAVKH